MTPHPVECFINNGEPYGRYVLPEGFEHSFLMIGWSSPSSFINVNTFPFPSGSIGKTYEREEVEVIELDDDLEIAIYESKSIFRLVPQPVGHSKTPDSCNQTDLLSENSRQSQPVEKEPETAEENARIENLNNSYNNRASKEISTGDAISTLDEANGYNKGFYDGWKAATDWQKKKEASR